MSAKVKLFTLILSIVANTPAYCDILLLEGIDKEPPNTLDGLPRPKTGMTAKHVLDVFGKPDNLTKPIGKPPISRWEYANFFVFFESDHVINTVMKKSNELQNNPEK